MEVQKCFASGVTKANDSFWVEYRVALAQDNSDVLPMSCLLILREGPPPNCLEDVPRAQLGVVDIGCGRREPECFGLRALRVLENQRESFIGAGKSTADEVGRLFERASAKRDNTDCLFRSFGMWFESESRFHIVLFLQAGINL